MSKSGNMLRTRRRDNNVKPNRRSDEPQSSRSRRQVLEKKDKFQRLDRKSSRGMLYENEELRLKTININAEIERGQSDIKKLKRENEMLKKEIWCLRDEYEKLDKLLKEKELEFSSSSTSGSSDSESSSSCSEESEEVETSQNLENVQKTNLKNLHVEFDHLSVVPEENSTENSDRASNRISLPNDNWNFEKDILKADQSYPDYDKTAKACTLPAQEKHPTHFFSPIKISKSFEETLTNPAEPTTSQKFMENYYWNRPQSFQTFKPNDFDDHSNFNNLGYNPSMGNRVILPNYAYYPNNDPGVKVNQPQRKMVDLPAINKTSTDLIVKLDNQNFKSTPSQSTFSNGGNLEELLKDIETISHDILEISNTQGKPPMQNAPPENGNFNFQLPNTSDSDIIYVPSSGSVELENTNNENLQNKPYKTELNVVLMPTAMPLIGFEKYKQIAKSCESLQKSLKDLSASQQDLAVLTDGTNVLPENREENFVIPSNSSFPVDRIASTLQTPATAQPPSSQLAIPPTLEPRKLSGDVSPHFRPADNNPFFFGYAEIKPKDSGQEKSQQSRDKSKRTEKELCSSKSNLLDLTSSDHVSSENEENIRLKTSCKSIDKLDDNSDNTKNNSKSDKKTSENKTPKLSIRRKVSIHFKGKKDKAKAAKNTENAQVDVHKVETPKVESKQESKVDAKHDSKADRKSDGKHDSTKPKTPGSERKFGLFEKHSEKKLHKTPSVDSKMESFAQEPKTPSSDSKSSADKKHRIESQTSSDSKTDKEKEKEKHDKKSRKSSSVSPDRKHGHKHDGKEKHKKHKKGDKLRNRRSTVSNDRFHRERSYSVCTDRSNILDHRYNYGFNSHYLYDDYSERERTNSLSSNETVHRRKLSNMSNFPVNGKIPWCGCWGNGCL